LADLPVGMAWRSFSLAACLVVVVAGSGDVLRAGSSSRARHVEEKRFQRQAADLSDALYWWTREPVRSHHRASAARQRLRQEAQRLMADGVWGGTLLDGYALRAPDAVLLVPLPVAGGERGAWQEGPNLPRFLAPRETLVSSSSEKVISSDPQGRTVTRTRRCDGQNCTETTQVHDAGEKFHEDPSFDRNSVDDRLATVSHAMAEELDRMHRSFGGSVDDMFSNIFSNDLTDEGLASSFDVHSSPEVHVNGSTVRSASRVTEMSNGHVITHTRRCEDGHCVENVTESNVGDESPAAKLKL